MNFVVTCIDMRTNNTKRFTIRGCDAIPPHCDHHGPSRTVAGFRARELFAFTLGEELNTENHKVLDITEINR